MAKTVICYDMYGKPYKVGVKRLAFRPSIYGILIEKNKILLSKQFDGYDFPGGGSEIHETITDTLKREFWEETGIRIKPVKIVRVGTSFHYSKIRQQYWNCPFFYFLVKKIGGKLSASNFDEHEKKYASLAEWIDVKKINRIKFINSFFGSQGSRKLIKEALKQYEK